MARKKSILKDYYAHYPWQKESRKARFIKFFKRHNAFGLMTDDIACLKVAQSLMNNFKPHETRASDPFFRRAEQALVNAIVFCLYFDHSPDDGEFVRVMNLLEKAREEAKYPGSDSCLVWMFAKETEKKPEHTGQRELDIFLMAAGSARYEVVDDILRNIKTPGNCKKMLSYAIKKEKAAR